MVRFWQAGEDNTKKVDLRMSKLGIKAGSQPLRATESPSHQASRTATSTLLACGAGNKARVYVQQAHAEM